MSDYIVEMKSVAHNPGPADLRKMVAKMPNAQKTEFGNYNVKIKVKARSKASTYIATDTPKEHADQTISREALGEVIKRQDDYIKNQDMIVIDGFIGPDPDTRTAVRLYIEQANANIAVMQQQLYFTPTADEFKSFQPELNVVYTPNLAMPGYPNDRLIAVDLQQGITRVMNSDYFGESKKGGLRMWNKLIYDRGGLALHAGCKEMTINGKRKIGLIIGLSGTGKTTTTFSEQYGSQPLQDDFIGWLPNGSVIGSENGCFAKTFGLTAKSEPSIHHAITQRDAYLENVAIKDDGQVDFCDDAYTQNGRATFPLSMIPNAGDVSNLPKVDFILILNRNQNLIPAVAKLNTEQAAGFFMLGETQGTSAGGAEEAGKFLRVPGTNPFFPLLHGQQGTRFLELLNQCNADVFLMNTGWVGGPSGSEHSRKVKIRHSSAVVQGIVDGSITWQTDDDFGYQIATAVKGLEGDDNFLLNPKSYYEKTNRLAQYQGIVDRLKTERIDHLSKYPTLSKDIIAAVS